MTDKLEERRRKDRERKRAERETFTERGLTRVEVTVPRDKADQIRALAEMLNSCQMGEANETR